MNSGLMTRLRAKPRLVAPPDRDLRRRDSTLARGKILLHRRGTESSLK